MAFELDRLTPWFLGFLLALPGCVLEPNPDDDDDAATDDDDVTTDDDTSDDDTTGDDDTTSVTDADGDGWDEAVDCDDTDANTYPGAPEICDGADNDCDGLVETLVPQDVPTILQAVADAATGDLVCIAEGTFSPTATIDFEGKGVTLRGAGWDSTVLLGSAANDFPAFQFLGNEDSDTRVEQLTVRSYRAANGAGAVVAAGTSPTFTEVHFEDNESEGTGAVYVEVASPIFENVFFDSNTASGGWGGGLYAYESDLVMTGGGFYGNHASEGGGAARVAGISPVFDGVTFSDNTTDGSGGAVYAIYGSPEFIDIVVEENSAAQQGGGLFFELAAGEIHRATIASNTAGSDGGGIHLEDDSTTALYDVLLQGNTANTGAGLSLAEGAAPLVDYSTIDGNIASAGMGGGVAIQGADGHFANVTISANSVMAHGGGAYITDGAEPVFTNCVIAGNSSTTGAGLAVSYGAQVDLYNVAVLDNNAAANGGGVHASSSDTDPCHVYLYGVALVGNQADIGGGIHMGEYATVTVRDGVLADNTASAGGGIDYDGGALDLGYTSAWNNSPNDYEGVTDPTGSDGNLNADPGFLDTSGADPLHWDLHLDPSSPLSDGGDPSGTDPFGGAPDMGIYGCYYGGSWDLDHDGYPEWGQPGTYDFASYPALGLDCDDSDAAVYPGSGC